MTANDRMKARARRQLALQLGLDVSASLPPVSVRDAAEVEPINRNPIARLEGCGDTIPKLPAYLEPFEPGAEPREMAHALDRAMIARIRKMKAGGKMPREIAKELGLALSCVYRHLGPQRMCRHCGGRKLHTVGCTRPRGKGTE